MSLLSSAIAAEFWLDPIGLAKSSGYNAHRLGEIRAIIARHELEFREKWREFCDQV